MHDVARGRIEAMTIGCSRNMIWVRSVERRHPNQYPARVPPSSQTFLIIVRPFEEGSQAAFRQSNQGADFTLVARNGLSVDLCLLWRPHADAPPPGAQSRLHFLGSRDDEGETYRSSSNLSTAISRLQSFLFVISLTIPDTVRVAEEFENGVNP